MPEIRPIKDLRHTTEISELCHECNEPIYSTKNGYEHLVVIDMKTYKKKLAKADLDEKLVEAETELNNKAELLDEEMVFKGLQEKYGRS